MRRRSPPPRRPTLETLILSTGFFRQKAKALIGMSQQLVEQHGGQVPADMEAADRSARRRAGRRRTSCSVTRLACRGCRSIVTCCGCRTASGSPMATTPEKVEAQLCAAAAEGDVDAGIGRPDPARPPHLPTQAAVRPLLGAQGLRVLSSRRVGRRAARATESQSGT